MDYDHQIEILDIDLSQLKNINLKKTILPEIGSKISPQATLYNNLGVLIFSGSNSADLFDQYYNLQSKYRVISKICNDGTKNVLINDIR